MNAYVYAIGTIPVISLLLYSNVCYLERLLQPIPNLQTKGVLLRDFRFSAGDYHSSCAHHSKRALIGIGVVATSSLDVVTVTVLLSLPLGHVVDNTVLLLLELVNHGSNHSEAQDTYIGANLGELFGSEVVLLVAVDARDAATEPGPLL